MRQHSMNGDGGMPDRRMRRTVMINVAVLGYGTIGAGVVEVLDTNADSIEKKQGTGSW